MNDYLKDYLQDSANQKQFQQDRLLVEVASLIFQEMEEEGISRKQLADALGVSKGRISHYLSGQCNLTLRTIADVFGAMGVRFRPSVESHRSSND